MNHTPQSTVEPARHKRPDSMLTEKQWASIARTLDITPRERQVIQGLFNGYTESVIADGLGISTHTVHTHLDRIYRKLQVSCRCDLVVRVFAEYVALNPSAPK